MLLRMLELEAQNPPVGEREPNGKTGKGVQDFGSCRERTRGASLPVPSGDLRWPAIAPSPLPIADIVIMALKDTRLSPGIFLEWLSVVQWNQCSSISAIPAGLSDVPGEESACPWSSG